MDDRNEIKMEILDLVDLLSESLKDLNTAANWGIFDILQGGFFTSVVKNSKITNAEDKLRKVSRRLPRLEREIEDINLEDELDIDISSILKFTDIFMDNIFSDLMVQSKINDIKYNVETLRKQLLNIHKSL